MMAALWAAFVVGFTATANMLCTVLGGACAVLLAALLVLLACMAVQVIFDRGTEALAAAWRRKGEAPRWRWAQAILKGTQEGGGDDGPADQKANDKVP